MIIRRATNDDIPRLVEMGEHFHTVTRYAKLINLNPANVAATARHLVNTDGCAVFVAEVDKLLVTPLVGMLGLATYVHPLSGELVAGELFWWVEPDYRGSTGLRLLAAAEQWAREAGAKKLAMIAPNGGVESIYRRLGFTRLEVNYHKELV